MTKGEIITAIAACKDKKTLGSITRVLNHESETEAEPGTRLLTQREAANRLGVSSTTVWRLIQSGAIGVRKVNNRPRIPLSEIVRFAGKEVR